MPKPAPKSARLDGSGTVVRSRLSKDTLVALASSTRVYTAIDAVPAGASTVAISRGIHVSVGLLEVISFEARALPGLVSTVPRLLPVPFAPLKNATCKNPALAPVRADEVKPYPVRLYSRPAED